MSSINMVPLFLGGRTSFIADRLGIPLHVYYLAHHWIGRMAVFEGILHTALAFTSLDAVDRAHSLISGLALVVALGAMSLLSLYPIRQFRFELFLKVHLLLSFITIGLLLWHLLPGNITKLLYPIIALFLWFSNAMFRLRQIRYNSVGARTKHQQVLITKYLRSPHIPGNLSDPEVGALKLEVEFERPMNIKPGQYLYISTNDLRFRHGFQSRPFAIVWWNDAPVGGGLVMTEQTKASGLTFLIEPRDGFTARLTKENALNHLSLDGPYGQDLRLESYDTVLLVAKGIGIAGMLSYAKQLIWWKSNSLQKRRVITRKLDIYWELDDNGQERWVGDYLRQLQDKNNLLSTPLLQIWCYFPEPKRSEPFIKLQDGVLDYQYFYPGGPTYTDIKDAVKEVTENAPGTSIVASCGVPTFTKEMRKAVLSTTNRENIIEFVEVEYRPTVPQTTTKTVDEIELSDVRPILVSKPVVHYESAGNVERQVEVTSFV
ncbi:uncharacterized protein PAC_14792 [Phialocephala subalpina]|uniref:FAD-binding FR-type domain-containing protein n=1 Tax=Phialocephala subalpina TaxID=576137 RepID=A0A1L7XIM7_9HELO|nr:uncharacterized protein PAC_14792 [Phialocephala subalpina]